MKGRNHPKTINGKPVVNASRSVSLHISPMDTKKGNVKNPGACAAALAAMREIPNCTAARVHLGRAYVYNEKKQHWVRFKTPESLRSEIIAFDRGGSFQPGEYKLRPLPPSELDPKIKNKARYEKHSGSDTNRSNTSRPAQAPVTKKHRKLHVVRGVRQSVVSR